MRANRINKYLVAAFALIILLFTIIANSQLVYAEESDITTEADTPTIYCYAAIDGKWETVQVLHDASGQQMFGNKNRYYMTAEDLEEVYGAFGFKASKFKEDSRIFAHTDAYDTSIIWTDAAPVGSGKDAKIPISFRNITYLYYVPGNTPDSESYFTTSKKVSDETLLKENTFYFIEFNDTSNAYRADLPSTTYIMRNESYKVKLSSIKGFKWKVVNAHTKEEITNATVDDNGLYATINIPEVKGSISIELLPEGQYILYDARLDDKLEKVGEFRAAQQEVSENGTVNGNGFFADVDYNNADVYTLLAPDKDYSISKLAGSISNGRKFYYTFKGWKIGDTDTILQPNDTLTKNELENYFAGEKELRLTAVWSPFSEDELHRINSLNFFVNINCEIMDTMSNGFQLQHPEEFTESVSATRVDNAENVPKSLGTEFMILAPPTEEDTAYEVDSALRNADTNPIEYGLAAENFPSDETVLSHLRKIQDTTNRPVLFNGQKVSAKDLTTENFAIRWYVLKYDSSDGWHIDGILVAKQGYLVVKKTFVGDEKVINTIKNNGFTLNVTHDEDGSTITDYILSISTQDQNGIVKGYSEYDEKTNTYTWILPLRQQRDYTVKELQYLPNEEQQKEWRCESSYITYNTDNKTDNWQQYDPDTGICVTAIAYPMDMPESSYQTIELQNSYVKAGMLTIAKLDSFTNRGMQNIAFKISREDGKEVGLFKKLSSNEYSNENFAILNGYTEKIENNIINTDVNGNIYIKLAVENEGLSGEYILEEITPDGYINPAKIHIKVTDDGTIKFIHTVLSEGAANVSGLDTEKLTIKNESRLLTSVIAQAKWHDTEKQDMQPVVIELWCNGAKVSGEKYTQTLSSKNDWSYEWSNLPLFVDGVLAQYSLKEAYIGDVSYDPKADTDGYVQYSILRDATLYKEGKDGTYQTNATWNDETDTTHYADNALLVTNIYPTNTNSKKANIEFTKTDSNGKFIPGAVFALYSDETCANKLATATSGDNGYVKFGECDNGTYYLKEIYAPENYSLENSIYKISVKNGKMTLLNADNTQVRTVVNETIPTTYINVQKIWNDNNNNDGIRPDSVIVTITGSNGFSKSTTINAANNWSCVFDKLPTKTQTGEGIEYSLHENDVDGYTASITKTNDTNYTITNTHIPESTIYIVSKQWNDEDNQDGIRPDSITVQLSDQYGNTYNGELSESTDWKYVFEDLPRYKNGEELHYALAENNVDGYSSEIAATGNIATLTNTHTPETIHYTIRKIWNDNDNSDGLRPNTITVHIQSEQGYDDTVTLTKENDWQDIEVTLPYFINGQEAHYTFTEDEVAEYETTIDESENVVTITNSHLPKTTNIHIEKVWDDNDNNDNVRPESISVILTGSNGSTYTADITAESNWEYNFEELPLYTEDGEWIEYSLEEQPVENYTTNIEKTENNFIITNTHKSETIDLTIQKVWDDEEDKYELRPMSIFIKVTGTDGYENTLKLSKQSDFKCTLQNLPKYSDGKLIEYSVFENEVIGYASSISEEDNIITITNKLMVRPIETAIPMPSQSPEPSESPKPSESPSPVPSPTKEPEITPSPTPTKSPIPSATPKPSQSPEPSSSPAPTPTITPEPSKEPVASPTPSPTITPEPTKEPEVTPAPTESPEPSETPTPTSTPENTPEPSSSPKPTETPVPTEVPDETPTPKPTESPIPTETPNSKPSIEIPVNTPTPAENTEENAEIPADTSIRINVIQVTNKQTGISFWKYLLSIFFRLS